MRKLKKSTWAKLLLLAACPLFLNATHQEDGVMLKMADGSYVVNTTTLAKDVTGYRGTTPLKITIKKDKVEKVEALKNQETPKYYARVKQQLFKEYEGKKVTKAAKMDVDAVTGATMTSDAVKENIKRGLDYYKKHR